MEKGAEKKTAEFGGFYLSGIFSDYDAGNNPRTIF